MIEGPAAVLVLEARGDEMPAIWRSRFLGGGDEGEERQGRNDVHEIRVRHGGHLFGFGQVRQTPRICPLTSSVPMRSLPRPLLSLESNPAGRRLSHKRGLSDISTCRDLRAGDGVEPAINFLAVIIKQARPTTLILCRKGVFKDCFYRDDLHRQADGLPGQPHRHGR